MSAPYVDLGAVSAYAAAREGGYTGTYQQFCTLLAGIDGLQPKLEAGQNIAISGSTIGTKAFPCNPNLLDNWYFGNPVNQRGQASYSGAYQMALDRWAINDITISSTGEISSLGSDPKIYQRVVANQYAIPVGTPITLSAVYAGELLTVSGTVSAGGNIVLIKEGTAAYISAWVLEGLQGIQIAPKAAGQLLAVKLELGDTQTLAHQDANGSWVLSEIPDYGEQLRRCRRYFYRRHLDGQYLGLGYGMAFTASRLRMYIPLPVTMRTGPYVTASSAVGENDMEAIYANPGTPNVFSLSSCTYMQWPDPDVSCIEFTASGMTQGGMYQIRTNGTAGARYIDFSAEL